MRLALLPLIPTGKTGSLMYTNDLTTLGTNPFPFFIPNEMSDPKFIDHFEIINHAHSVLGSVSFI